jgi:hypothetical protein
MNRRFRRRHLAVVLAALFIVSAPGTAGDKSFLPNMLPFANPTGIAATYSTVGKIDITGPFFQSLGTNGRACVSCHQPSTGWTVTPANIRARFEATDGTDPIFRTNSADHCAARGDRRPRRAPRCRHVVPVQLWSGSEHASATADGARIGASAFGRTGGTNRGAVSVRRGANTLIRRSGKPRRQERKSYELETNSDLHGGDASAGVR